MREHGAAAEHAATGARTIGRAFELDGAYAVAELRAHGSGRSELGGQGERELEGIGHVAVGFDRVSVDDITLAFAAGARVNVGMLPYRAHGSPKR